ncbi:MAG: glycosyltransferase family 4 protein [Thermoanaerobaculia bacterium]
MRIFQILEFNQFNTGSVHQMFQAAVGLRRRGHDVTIISRADRTLEEKSRENGIDFVPMPLRNPFDLASIFALRRLIRERRPDIIHAHKGVSHGLSLWAMWRLPVGAFIVNRGVSFPLDMWNRIKYRTRRVNRVVTVCEQIRQVVIASGKLPPDKVVVVYAGTDVAVFDPDRCDARAFRREKGIPDDRFLVAQVGVRDWKGWKELVDAIHDIAVESPKVHLALIGCRNDAEKAAVMAYAQERGIHDRVSAIEYRTDMPNVFASCDVVVDASWAGTGITGTIREAMAMRKPVIATDAGGNGELVSSSSVGWLVPVKNHAALVAALRDVISDRARAAAVAEHAREHIVRGFSSELRITRLEELYRSLTS